MHSGQHARSSAAHWGGTPEDYYRIHKFIDSSKAHQGDVRHRALLHSTFGVFMAEEVFGTTIQTSKGRMVYVRDIVERHIMEDLGKIPVVTDWLSLLPLQQWMGGKMPTRIRFLPASLGASPAESPEENAPVLTDPKEPSRP